MSPQYVYVMKELNKVWPGGKQVIKDGWLSFLPGAKIGVLGKRCRKINFIENNGRNR